MSAALLLEVAGMKYRGIVIVQLVFSQIWFVPVVALQRKWQKISGILWVKFWISCCICPLNFVFLFLDSETSMLTFADYKLGVHVDEQNPSKPLQVAHAPQIQGSESSKVSQAIRVRNRRFHAFFQRCLQKKKRKKTCELFSSEILSCFPTDVFGLLETFHHADLNVKKQERKKEKYKNIRSCSRVIIYRWRNCWFTPSKWEVQPSWRIWNANSAAMFLANVSFPSHFVLLHVPSLLWRIQFTLFFCYFQASCGTCRQCFMFQYWTPVWATRSSAFLSTFRRATSWSPSVARVSFRRLKSLLLLCSVPPCYLHFYTDAGHTCQMNL